MRTVCFFFFFFFSFLSVIQAQWIKRSTGVYGGRITVLVTNGTDLFMGTKGAGVFRSTDNGTTWNAVNSGLPSSQYLGIKTLVVSGSNLLVEIEGGVYFTSNDNGNSWSQLHINLAGSPTINTFVVNGTSIFVGTSNGIFVSNNSGSTWTASNNGIINDSNNLNVVSLAISASTILAGTHGNLYVSTDNGNSWTTVTPALSFVVTLTVAGSKVFANSIDGVHISSDNGVSWLKAGVDADQMTSFAIANNKIFGGSNSGVSVSSDNGATWTDLNWFYGNSSVSVTSLTAIGSNLFAGTYSQGTFISIDSGLSWNSIKNGVTNPSVITLKTIGSSIFAGTESGIYSSSDNGMIWNAAGTTIQNLINLPISSFAVSGSNIFAGASVVYKSTGGTNWANTGTGTTYPINVNCMAVNGSTLFVGTDYNGGLLSSTDNGNTWTLANSGLPTSNLIVNCLAVNVGTVFAGTNGGLFRSSDNGANWTSINTGLPGNANGNRPISIIFNGNYIFVGYTVDGVYRSSDNGSNWTKVNSGGVNTLALSGTNIFLGTDYGVYFSSDNGNTWTDYSIGLPTGLSPCSGCSSPMNVNTLEVLGNNLFAGTDFGIYSATLPLTLSIKRGNSAAASVGSKVLFAGGTTYINQYLDVATVDIYDNSNNTWTTSSLSLARPGLGATSVGQKVFFAGGYVVDIFNNSTNSWTTSNLSQIKTNVVATSVGTKAFFAGDYSNVVDIYDNSTSSWSTDLFSIGRSGFSAASNGTKIFFAGGYASGYTNVVDIFDNSTNAWSTATLSQARSRLSATSVGTKVFFAGGELGGGAYSDVVDIYDNSTNTWTTATLSTARRFTTAISNGSKVFFAGGDGADGYSSVIDIFDNSTNSWSTASLSSAREQIGAASVDSRVFFAGGYTGAGQFGFTSVIDIYNNSTSPVPTISSFNPTNGKTGTTVTISGTNLAEITGVSFGGVSATSFNVSSTTSITAVVASGNSGNVSVTTPGGTATLPGFTFFQLPNINSINPTNAGSGATVTILGNNFTGATAVSFGGTAATSFNVVSATNITAVVGSGASGNVTVTAPGGTAALAGFVFIPAPTISSFNPTSAGSGTTVAITGTNFTGVTAVSFGGTAATSFNVVSATSITAVVASGTSGSVSVTTAGGTATLAGFSYIPSPTISSFNPTNAASAATVTITGTNFTGATAVSFGGTAATSFSVVSPTSITAVVAAGASGSVSVTTPAGTVALAGFVFIPAPVISAFNPPTAGAGSTVTITGNNFTGATAVSFGGTAATSFNVASATSITAIVASGTSGNVSVTTPGGTGTLAGFTFIPAPTISSFNPTSAGNGGTVTITGTNLTGATLVSFGGTSATSFNVASATSIIAVVATGTSGSVSVTTPGGTATLAGFNFTPAAVTFTESFITTYDKGSTLTASITVNDPNLVSVVNFKSRGITEAATALKSVVVTGVGNKYEKIVAASDLTDPIGLLYSFEVLNKATPAVAVNSTTGKAYVKFPTASTDQVLPGLSFGDQVSNYQIIAVPLELTDKSVTKVFAPLMPYDKTKWRLFDYASNDNREYSAFSTIDAGKGYWLIVKTSTTINPGEGKAVQADDATPFTINLTTGWNLIGNPYNFRVSWPDVLTANSNPAGVGTSLKIFSAGALTDGTVLEKYRGAFVFSNNAVALKIPVLKTLTGRTDEVKENENSLDQNHWEVKLKLKQGVLSNELGGIGMNPKATMKGKDEFDEVSVPLPDGLGLFELAYPHPEVFADFNKEVVPTQENFTWDFDIKRDDPSASIDLSWVNNYFGENDKQLVLFDPSTLQVVDMRLTNHFMVTERTEKVRIFFGGKEYVQRALDKELPWLGSPYPVPAREELTIPFRVPESHDQMMVQIKIYNAQGAEVATPMNRPLPKGSYTIKWLPQGESGLYVIRMRIGQEETRAMKVIIN